MSDNSVVLMSIPSLFVVMLLLLEVGRRLGARHVGEETEHERSGWGLMEAAMYGLLGLLIAFTVAGAGSRYDRRRALTVQEANAIGTAYLRLNLLPPAAQPALREKFRSYTEARLRVFQALPDVDASNAQDARAKQLQQDIWNGAIAALHDAPQASSMLLLPALNDMIDITTTRAVELKAHTPIPILGVLVLLAVLCCLLGGYSVAGGKQLGSRLHMLGFAVVVTLTVYVIFDLDHPRVGLIRLDYADQAFLDLLTMMK